MPLFVPMDFLLPSCAVSHLFHPGHPPLLFNPARTARILTQQTSETPDLLITALGSFLAYGRAPSGENIFASEIEQCGGECPP